LRFRPYLRDLRRANLKRFPYHFLYRILSDRIRVIAVPDAQSDGSNLHKTPVNIGP
jgi:hypothetical protein